jgi:cytochrome c peroxidase
MALGLSAISAQADVANAEMLAQKYATIAKIVNTGYEGPSAIAGKIFFNRKIKGAHDKEVACASCHTANPADEGKHIVTGKAIRPLSPAVNSKRFNDRDKVEDKFTEHCKDVVGTDCLPEEKANFIAYLLTEKTPSAKK